MVPATSCIIAMGGAVPETFGLLWKTEPYGCLTSKLKLSGAAPLREKGQACLAQKHAVTACFMCSNMPRVREAYHLLQGWAVLGAYEMLQQLPLTTPQIHHLLYPTLLQHPCRQSPAVLHSLLNMCVACITPDCACASWY